MVRSVSTIFFKSSLFHFLFFFWVLEPLSCGSPDSMQNTTVTGKNFSIGGEIEYSCPIGHSLVGDAVRSCQKNGVWSAHAPSCKCKFL